MTQKEEIIEIIKRPNLMLGDIKTFIWVRSTLLSEYKTQKYGVGGGNFLMTLGCLSIMYFMAKCHYILKMGCDLDFKYIDERESLEILITEFPVWKLSKEELGQLRDFFRNPLAHTGSPLKSVQSTEYMQVKDFDKVLEFLKEETDSTFVLEGKKISLIKSDLFLRDILKTQAWLLSQIKREMFKEKNLALLKDKLKKEEVEI